jgi:hypothetical protein
MKGMKRLLKMMKKDAENIQSIHVSEQFALLLKAKAKHIEIDVKQYKHRESGELIDQYFLFSIPMHFSNVIQQGAVLEMKNGESIILKI